MLWASFIPADSWASHWWDRASNRASYRGLPTVDGVERTQNVFAGTQARARRKIVLGIFAAHGDRYGQKTFSGPYSIAIAARIIFQDDFLRALGLRSGEDILRTFYTVDRLVVRDKKLYWTLDPTRRSPRICWE